MTFFLTKLNPSLAHKSHTLSTITQLAHEELLNSELQILSFTDSKSYLFLHVLNFPLTRLEGFI